MKLLHIDSSINGATSASRQLSASIVGQLKQLHPGLEVSYRDLAGSPLPQLDEALWAAKLAGAGGDAAASAPPAPAAVRDGMAQMAATLADFVAADIVVIGAPMYNFGIPSQLKAWIDSIAAPGVTFKYSPTGAEGLCGGKRVIVASTRGAMFAAPSPIAALDHQESYLSGFFGFLGIPAVEFVRAEGLAYGAEPRQQALDAAQTRIAALAA